ncbi:MAG: family 78 glycoside hydrolase catalytic domain [Acidobacteria bacterium]|nr:family 78 glycoside hydrolase catalytic domain [Acidobacteriota bacterium]
MIDVMSWMKRSVRPGILVALVIVLVAGWSQPQQASAQKPVDRNTERGREQIVSGKPSLVAYGARDADGRQQIFVVRPDGSGKKRLTQDGNRNYFPAWSSDGKRVAFTSNRSGAPQIWVIDADGRNATQLTTQGENEFPTWSPDGKRLAFGSNRTGNFEIWVMESDGSNQKRLTTTAAATTNNAANWSPDGRRIAFCSTRSGHYAIWVMESDGSHPTQLTFPHGDRYPDGNVPVWSPDGSKIAFWSGIEPKYGNVWVMDADGRNRKQLTDQPPGINCDEPVWSADGRQILFASNRPGSQGIGIWIMEADGSKQRILITDTHAQSRPSWQPSPQAPAEAPKKTGPHNLRAEWIWEPIEGAQPFFVDGPLFESRPFKNLFVYFRKTFDLSEGADRALAQISADSRYKLYVNGHYVGRGPARCDPIWQYYDEYDIAPLLRPGRNVIAALVHYYGEKTGWYEVGRPGFLFHCRLEKSGRQSTLLKSDTTWKSLRAPAWMQDAPRVNGALGFVEIYDATQEVEGWDLPNYDDSRWRGVQIISRVSGNDPPLMAPFPWENLVPRDIPMLLEKEIAPSQVTLVGEVQDLLPGAAPTLAHQMSQEAPGPLKNCTVENAKSLASGAGGEAVIRTMPPGEHNTPGYSAVLVLDFGREVTGYPRLELEGVAGGIVDMGVSESLANGRVTPTRNGLHFNRYVMKDGPQRWEAFEWDGFRYLQLTIRNCPRPIKLRKATVNFTSYPVGNRGSFESSDPLLNKIWETSRYTTQLCMHDAYEDCPNREQRQWVGDAYVQTKVNYAVFGDTKLAAKLLRQVAQSQRSDGLIMMFYPGDDKFGVVGIFNIKDFTLHWIGTIWEYYRFTGDRGMVRALYPNMVKAVGWFEQRVDSQGLLADVTPWIFGDWAPLDRRGQNTILNALFYNTLQQTSRMAELVGDEAAKQRYDNLAGRIKAGINERLWDERRGVYVDANVEGVLSRRVSQQSNALCLLYDIASPEKRSRILSYIFDQDRITPPAKWGSAEAPESSVSTESSLQVIVDEERQVVQAQPFFMHWVNAALAHNGEHERMVRLIRDLWGKMIDAGATTIWETWSREASECHGWSATPASDLTTYVLGVRGVTAGFGDFVVEPHPAGLEWARGVFPSVKGDIHVSWRSSVEEFRIEGSLPTATTASVLIPAQSGKKASLVQLNGNVVWRGGTAVEGVRVKAEKDGIRVGLSMQGRYEIVARY